MVVEVSRLSRASESSPIAIMLFVVDFNSKFHVRILARMLAVMRCARGSCPCGLV